MGGLALLAVRPKPKARGLLGNKRGTDMQHRMVGRLAPPGKSA
jgi:hypothetical protein